MKEIIIPVAPSGDERVAYEYSFTHSSATGRGETTIGPCLTYDRAQAYGVGCFGQREVAVSAATKPTADMSGLKRWNLAQDYDPIHDAGWGEMVAHADGEFVKFADVQSLLATKPAAAPKDEQHDLHVAPPTRGTDSRVSINESVKFQALLVDLLCSVKKGESLTTQTGKVLALTDFIDSELELASRGRAQGGITQDDERCANCGLSCEVGNCTYPSPMASADAVIEAREQALEEAAKLFDENPHAEQFHTNIAEEIRALKGGR